MYADYHLHCEYSDDSNEPMENQIQEAITLGLDEMCFTDHVDYGIKRDWDDPEGIIIRHAIEHGKEVDLVLANVNYPKYFEALNMYQKKYASSISIKKGLEFGIQSITVDAYGKLYASYQDDLDFILFSMHQVNNLEFWTQDFQKEKTQKQYNDEYYKEIYQTNAENYKAKLSTLDQKYQETVDTDRQNTLIFADRFAFRYLVDDYGLNYYAAFSGCSAESEASFKTVTFLAGKLDELGIKTVLTIEKSDDRIAQTVIENTKKKDQKILELNSMQSITSDEIKNGVTYLSVMEDNLKVLKEALK